MLDTGYTYTHELWSVDSTGTVTTLASADTALVNQVSYDVAAGTFSMTLVQNWVSDNSASYKYKHMLKMDMVGCPSV